MGDFMRYDILDLSRNPESRTHWTIAARLEERVGENDGAGILHSSEACRADYQSQLFVGIRRDRLTEISHCRRGRSKSPGSISRILLRHIIRERCNSIFLGIDLHTLADRNHHAVGGYRFRFFESPNRWSAAISGHRERLAVSDYQFARRRGYGKRNRSLG